MKAPIPQWLSLAHAADVLDESVDSLRKKIDRNVHIKDGRVESHVDGILCRKFCNLWKVQLGVWGQK